MEKFIKFIYRKNETAKATKTKKARFIIAL
jgi:hypothetical protein